MWHSLLILVWQWALALLPLWQFPCNTLLGSILLLLWLINWIDVFVHCSFHYTFEFLKCFIVLICVQLSKDDFTVFGGVFGNKQDSAFPNLEVCFNNIYISPKWRWFCLANNTDNFFHPHLFKTALQSSSSSVTLPASEWSGSSAILSLLQEKLGVSPLLVDADTLSHLSVDTSVSNLLLINLPYCTE